MKRRGIKNNTYDFSDHLPKTEKKLLKLPKQIKELKSAVDDTNTSASVRQLCADELKSLNPEVSRYNRRKREFLALHWVVSHFDPLFCETGYLLENYERSGQRKELIRMALRKFNLDCKPSTFQTWLDRATMPNCATFFNIPPPLDIY